MKRFLIAILFIVTGFWLINSCTSTSKTNKPVLDSTAFPFSTYRNMSSEHDQKQETKKRQIDSHQQPIQTFINKKPGCTLNSGSAAILAYHQFDEADETTSITIEKFNQHLRFFKNQGYSVVPISMIISAINGSIPFEKKWIAITIDDADKSFLKVKPLLEQFNYPYTISINTEMVEQKHTNSMSWDDLKQIAESNLGELASQGHAQSSLVRDLTPQERQADILLSVKKIYEHTEILPRFFSYPYGETSENFINEVTNIQEIIDEENFYFLAAVSNQPGPVGCSSDLFSLPRFTMNDKQGVINDLFKTKINSLHLPVYDVSPRNKAVCLSESTNTLYFSTPANIDLQNLNCYTDRGNSVTVQVSKDKVKLRLKNALGAGIQDTKDMKEQMNCTLQDKTTNQLFWYGQEFTLLDHSKECSKAQ